jgi:hypothetical protein
MYIHEVLQDQQLAIHQLPMIPFNMLLTNRTNTRHTYTLFSGTDDGRAKIRMAAQQLDDSFVIS